MVPPRLPRDSRRKQRAAPPRRVVVRYTTPRRCPSATAVPTFHFFVHSCTPPTSSSSSSTPTGRHRHRPYPGAAAQVHVHIPRSTIALPPSGSTRTPPQSPPLESVRYPLSSLLRLHQPNRRGLGFFLLLMHY
jgi:hypothetical protein